MDPNANLFEQITIVARMKQRSDAYAYGEGDTSQRAFDTAQANDGMRLAELVDALNAWIVNGGFLPTAWYWRQPLGARLVCQNKIGSEQ